MVEKWLQDKLTSVTVHDKDPSPFRTEVADLAIVSHWNFLKTSVHNFNNQTS